MLYAAILFKLSRIECTVVERAQVMIASILNLIETGEHLLFLSGALLLSY